jgi:hypothetical protein
MSERTPRDIAKAAQWTVEKIAERFEQMPFPAHDIAHGDGQQIGTPTDRYDAFLVHRAEFYPDAGVVRVVTPDVRIELFRAAPPTVGEDGVRVENETGTSRVLFRRDGHVAVEILPPALPEPPHAPVTPSSPTEGPTDPPSPADASQTHPTPPEDHPSRSSGR